MLRVGCLMRVALENALFVVCCSLLVNARCLVFVVGCLLFVAVVRRALLFGGCRCRLSLFVVCCLLLVGC